MEKLIYESKFEKIFLNEEKRELFQDWFITTSEMSEEDLKFEQIKMAELFEQYKPLYHLADARKFGFPILPDLQLWINENIATRVKASGTKKSAMILPEDLISALSIEQLGDDIEHDLGKPEEYSVSVFKSAEDARKWFYNNKPI